MDSEKVHIAITRRVKPGHERAFEQALREFARQSLKAPGVAGVNMIGPAPDAANPEFGILRSFDTSAAAEEFYNSELFRSYEAQVAPLVEGEAHYRRLHGLEAFFRDPARSPPPRWKMAIVTWLGVFPAVYVWSSILRGALVGVHPLLATAIVSALVVITLAWAVMPLLTNLLAPWLHHHSS